MRILAPAPTHQLPYFGRISSRHLACNNDGDRSMKYSTKHIVDSLCRQQCLIIGGQVTCPAQGGGRIFKCLPYALVFDLSRLCNGHHAQGVKVCSDRSAIKTARVSKSSLFDAYLWTSSRNHSFSNVGSGESSKRNLARKYLEYTIRTKHRAPKIKRGARE